MKVTKGIAHIQPIWSRRLISDFLNYWPILTLCSLAALVFLKGLGESSLVDWDEAIYAQISKEIVQGGDWLTLHWQYKPYLRKPPILMWSTAIFYQLFEINEFWSRAASAFSGIGLIGITYLVGKFVYDRCVGFFAAVILLTSNFVSYARFGTTDIILTLFTYLAVYAYLRLEKGCQKWWYMIWISCALAFMTKSVAGLIAPVTITLSLLLNKKFVSTAQSRHFWQGLILAFVIVIPWHVLMYVQHGQAFIDQYIGHSIVERSISVLEGNTGGPFYYVEQLQEDFSPWFFLLPFALALSVQENIDSKSRSRILLLVFILVFGLYTIASTKLTWYIVPLYPAVAILIASMVTHAFKNYHSIAFSGLAVAITVVVLIAPLKIVVIFGCVGSLIIFLLLKIPKKLVYQLSVVVMCAFLVVVGTKMIEPLYSTREAPVAKLARLAGSKTPNDRESLIVFSGLYQPTPLFYSDRPVKEATTPQALADFTKDHQTKRIILAAEDIKSLSIAYEIHVLAEAKPLVYATIKVKTMQ